MHLVNLIKFMSNLCRMTLIMSNLCSQELRSYVPICELKLLVIYLWICEIIFVNLWSWSNEFYLLQIASNNVDAQSLEAGYAGNIVRRCRAVKDGAIVRRAMVDGVAKARPHWSHHMPYMLSIRYSTSFVLLPLMYVHQFLLVQGHSYRHSMQL